MSGNAARFRNGDGVKSSAMIYFKPKKYGNSTCSVDGLKFDSRREADYYGQLKLEKRAGLIKEFRRQVEVDLFAWDGDEGSKRVCCHRVDFLVTMPDGSEQVREVKGFATDLWDLKRKIFEANYPDIHYKVIR